MLTPSRSTQTHGYPASPYNSPLPLSDRLKREFDARNKAALRYERQLLKSKDFLQEARDKKQNPSTWARKLAEQRAGQEYPLHFPDFDYEEPKDSYHSTTDKPAPWPDFNPHGNEELSKILWKTFGELFILTPWLSEHIRYHHVTPGGRGGTCVLALHPRTGSKTKHVSI